MGDGRGGKAATSYVHSTSAQGTHWSTQDNSCLVRGARGSFLNGINQTRSSRNLSSPLFRVALNLEVSQHSVKKPNSVPERLILPLPGKVTNAEPAPVAGPLRAGADLVTKNTKNHLRSFPHLTAASKWLQTCSVTYPGTQQILPSVLVPGGYSSLRCPSVDWTQR